jgi:hypothetical protein
MMARVPLSTCRCAPLMQHKPCTGHAAIQPCAGMDPAMPTVPAVPAMPAIMAWHAPLAGPEAPRPGPAQQQHSGLA